MELAKFRGRLQSELRNVEEESAEFENVVLQYILQMC